MSMPNKRYGRASMNIPKKTVAKRLSLEPSSRNSLHGRILNKIITSTPINTSHMIGRDVVRVVTIIF